MSDDLTADETIWQIRFRAYSEAELIGFVRRTTSNSTTRVAMEELERRREPRQPAARGGSRAYRRERPSLPHRLGQTGGHR